ncbi:lysosomal acid glucosylceramidase-like [Macrobrachium rosenbergii]|uniref:lysosomal acid glucosylceramidase-like n=1 Tax=Macrobrachium rosenbergii TaxID=79674 RepID=UPI0034D72502
MRVGVVLFLVFVAGVNGEGEKCIPRYFGHSSFACVCNATYCDTLPRPPALAGGEFLLCTSDMETNRFLMKSHAFDETGGNGTTEVNDFILDPEITYQTVLGFGGAFTDSAAKNWLSLSTGAQDHLLRSYFSSVGIEYNVGRVNMGGCDFSWRTYSYDDVEGDVALEHFALQEEDTAYKIPMIQRAKEMSEKPIKLFASPWSAPKWMKSNKEFQGMGHLLKEMYQPWAEYFVKFFKSYLEYDLDFWGVTAQNEPMDGNIPYFWFNCMGWTAETQRKWIAEHLGPTLENNNLGDLKLMIMDDQRLLLPSWPATVLNDTEAAKYVDGIAIHWYWDQFSSPELLTRTHELFPDTFLMGTEACVGDKPYEAEVAIGAWERLERYAHDIITDFNHWVTGWTDWNLALDTQGGPNWAGNFVDSAIIVNETADEFYKNPMFYAMGHFSKFVQEGAQRVELTPVNQVSLKTVAFRNSDNSVAIVVLNKSGREIEARIQTPTLGSINVLVGPRSLHTVYYV